MAAARAPAEAQAPCKSVATTTATNQQGEERCRSISVMDWTSKPAARPRPTTSAAGLAAGRRRFRPPSNRQSTSWMRSRQDGPRLANRLRPLHSSKHTMCMGRPQRRRAHSRCTLRAPTPTALAHRAHTPAQVPELWRDRTH
eukprot:15449107-Alexandrium_andersonii.AAC.1